jgi:eukaryotic-like serine/threonine-protein kinase
VIAGRYDVVRKIGEGGMQEVFLASDQLLGKSVALKRAKNGSAERRFKRSAVLSARVNHPNVAKTLDYVDTEQPYLVEEFIDGCDLSHLLDNLLLVVDPILATQIAHGIVKGVAASHGQNVLHRDIKPSNIMIAGGLKLIGAKVTDFGIAKMTEDEFVDAAEGGNATITTSKTVVGALPYMAPEAIETPRSVTLAADVWSLGAVAYELVYGKKPFGAGLIAVRNITAGKPPPYHAPDSGTQFAPTLNQLRELIQASLQHDPEARPTASQLASRFGDLCYSTDPRYTGIVTEIRYGSWGFIQQDEGPQVFFHLSSVYGPRPRVGERVFFAKYPGGGAERAFPVVKLKA